MVRARTREQGSSVTRAGRDRSYAIQQRNRRVLAASNICWICGEPGADAADHVIPLALGGADETWNLRPAHHKTPNSRGVRCNLTKGAKAPPPNFTTSRQW